MNYELLVDTLSRSWDVSWVILVILTLRIMFRHVIPAQWVYVLWFAAIIHLLFPRLPENVVSDYREVVKFSTILPTEQHLEQTEVSLIPTTEVPSPRPYSWQSLATGIWLAGILLLGIRWSLAAYSLNNLMKSSTHRPQAIQMQANQLAESLGIRQKVTVCLSERFSTPAVTGLWKPRIILPQRCRHLDREKMEVILMHELSHVKRLDLWVDWLMNVLVSIHWFNPLLWVSRHYMRRDRELACDADALSRLQGASAKTYADTLFDFSIHPSSRPVPLCLGISESGNTLKQRLNRILNYRKPSLKLSLCSASLFSLLLIWSLSQPRQLQSNTITGDEQIELKVKLIQISAKSEDRETWAKIKAAIQAADYEGLRNDKIADVLGAPVIIVTNGTKAHFTVSREFAYPTGLENDPENNQSKPASFETIPIRVRMECTPHLTDSLIHIFCDVEINEIADNSFDSNSNEMPVINTIFNVEVRDKQPFMFSVPDKTTTRTIKVEDINEWTGKTTHSTEQVSEKLLVYLEARIVDPTEPQPIEHP